MKPVIELKDVWKTYTMGENKIHALRGVSLTIQKGEFVAIQGPSGSGKSTAMNMVGCLDVPSKGEIYLDGVNIAKLSESSLAQIRGRKIGFIFQKFNLISTLSAWENVMLPLTFQGMNESERRKRAKERLEAAGLGDRMNHKPNELSGGQQQRVAIARALVTDPEVILADEPTGNLDSKTGATVMQYLQELHQKGKTIIMVTHDDKLAHYADRIAFLKDGIIIKATKADKTKTQVIA
ncbi:ABC transporter ATP-binding protein [Candidatus Woesearchaeota archaeon]|nr:MAG: ABC transporter ATP-binding protein [Candidatus Woesearchaeota archaeon]